MDWTTLKEALYNFDGTWLDIYILDTTTDDWKKWLDLVNDNYAVGFYNGESAKLESRIDFQVVLDFWTGKTDLLNGASIELNGIDIKCHFFDEEQIENDFDPRQIKTLDDHKRLMDYLWTVSTGLNKRVIVTPENLKDIILIDCHNDIIKIMPPSD